MNNLKLHPASYRDPAGFIFEYEGKYYRQVNQSYADDYALLKKSGLYDLLVQQKKIIAHTEINENFTGMPAWHTTLLPAQLNFISYPYEWCFSQWKEAALLTLDLAKRSVQHGMILKDATPFNIQFVNGGPVLIDSLSFEKYDATKPWVAYRQFTECFLAPLLLAKYRSAEMLKMFQLYPDGIPLKLVSKLLPAKSRFNLSVFLHVHMQGMVAGGKGTTAKKQIVFSKEKLLNIINNLYSYVNTLSLPAAASVWNNYYEETILSQQYADAKMAAIKKWLNEIPAHIVLDIGCNTGLFAMEAAGAGKFTIAIDADEACIEKLYNTCKQKKILNLVALCADITNPAPAIGWDNKERAAFLQRAQPDLVMALALVHHLAIGKNIGFAQMAEVFSKLGNYLIVEFVPKEDPKVILLLQEREDIFNSYSKEVFEKVFGQFFSFVCSLVVPGTVRTLYLMKRR